jgi:hypothetical protein
LADKSFKNSSGPNLEEKKKEVGENHNKIESRVTRMPLGSVRVVFGLALTLMLAAPSPARCAPQLPVGLLLPSAQRGGGRSHLLGALLAAHHVNTGSEHLPPDVAAALARLAQKGEVACALLFWYGGMLLSYDVACGGGCGHSLLWLLICLFVFSPLLPFFFSFLFFFFFVFHGKGMLRSIALG